MSTYTLPDLRYDFGALEPHISGKIMELHHDKHHAAYVKGANDALEKLDEARDKEDFTRLGALEKSLAFNLSGHVLHSLFWQNLTPKGGGEPEGELAEAIANDFGSFAEMKRQLTEVASTIMGSGWGGSRLGAARRQAPDHADLRPPVQPGPGRRARSWCSTPGSTPTTSSTRTRRPTSSQAVWSVWNWEDVAERFAAVRSLDVSLAGAVRVAITPGSRSGQFAARGSPARGSLANSR